MSKKKKAYKLIPLEDEGKTYYVYADSGYGYEHEYTIKELDVESGTLYSMEYSNSMTWSEEQRGVNIFHLLNNGDGYQWIDTNPMNSTIEYDEFYMYSVFFRIIQELESNDRFSTKIMEIKELATFNF